jgi:hypothetical protein
MAAGLGFKTFTTGEVLTAADTNGYLMQGILVFADATARDAAITAPEEGQFAYLKDTNVTTYYTGSAWANVDTTGMTNPMTTTGDIIYSSSGSTPARLGIGTAGQVLSVNSGANAPEWAAPATPAVVGCSIKRENVSTSLTGNVMLTIAFTTENFDSDSFHDNSVNNSRITIPSGKGGKYLISAFINNPAGSYAYCILRLLKNGSQFTAMGNREGDIDRDLTDPIMSASQVVTLAAADYLELQYQQSETATRDLWVILSAIYLGA